MEVSQNLKIIFISTPEFGAIILEGLISGGYKPDLVITETDKPTGRKHIITPPPVKILSERFEIPVMQPEKILNLKSEISNLKPDLIIVAAYGQMIPKEILKIPKYGCLNIHPSLLPKYRGPSPIQAAILNGDVKTGATIMLLDDKMDHGPILANGKLQIADSITYRQLHDELAKLGVKLLLDVLPVWINKKIELTPQDEKMATYTKILKREDGRIDWKKSAAEIERQIRAFIPWPGSFTEFKENIAKAKNFKVWMAKIKEQTPTSPVGVPGKTFMATNEQIAVQTGKDFLIIEELQPEGGKRMSAADFSKSRPDFIGTVLI